MTEWLNVKTSKNSYTPKLDKGIKVKISQAKRRYKNCEFSLSAEAKQAQLGEYAEVLINPQAKKIKIKAGNKETGYKLRPSTPHLRFRLPEVLNGEIGDVSNQSITVEKDSIIFDWPFKDAQNITKLQPDEEKTIVQAAARTVTPQTQIKALKSDSAQQKKTVTQEQVIEILRNTSHAMTASEIADRLNLTNSDNRLDVNKRLHRLHSSKKVLVIKNQWARNSYKINPDYEKATRKPAQTQGIYAPEPSKKEDKNQVILELIKNSGHAVSLDELTAKSPYNYGTCYNAINKLIQQRKIMMTNRKPVMVKVA